MKISMRSVMTHHADTAPFSARNGLLSLSVGTDGKRFACCSNGSSRDS